ncbi:MAG: helix-turn-helix transcriptional regulator [Pseudomonadota bacterium]
MAEYLTTKELAALLRIKERKVYDLAASGKIPVSRATGKLLFPRAEIDAWIATGTDGAVQAPAVIPAARNAAAERTRPNIVLGSHDPLLEWSLKESGSGLAAYFDGSGDGLRRFAAGEGIAAGVHLYDAAADDWNTAAALGPVAQTPSVAIDWAKRRRGLILRDGVADRVGSLADLVGVRFAGRQSDAGAQVLLAAKLREAAVSDSAINTTVVARSETDAVMALVEDRADACFGLEMLAAQFKLVFVPIVEERFDLIVDRRAYFEAPLQSLLEFTRTKAFAAKAEAFPGYNTTGLGAVRFNGP